jgi:hypothetical protein
MTTYRSAILAVPALVLVAACGRGNDAKMDDALRNDLALASSQAAYNPQQFVSPMEQGYAQRAGYGQVRPANATYGYPAPARPAPTIRRAPQPVYSGTGGTRETEVKNTKRDAIIGATAGAAIGVATARDKWKGAVVGAAAGGLLGAIIGHTVDVKKVPY